MSGWAQFLCVSLKRSLSSMLPWDIPWYDPSHTVFFAALYGALAVIGLGLLLAALTTASRLRKDRNGHH